jgi:hypothetical protein
MRGWRRMVSVTVGVLATAGLVISGSGPALAVDPPQAYVVLYAADDLACGALLLSAQVSPSGPADVSVYIENQNAHKACVGWLERSSNKGKTWVIVSPKVSVPSSNTVFTWAKTGDYADGPGLRARSCVRKGTGPVVCSAAMSLSKSKQRDTGASAPVGYMQRQVHNSSFICSGTLSSAAAAKIATSVVDAFISNFSSTKPCSGVLQESTNGGKTWHAVSATHIIPAPDNDNAILTMGFTARYADGKGHLARVCITVAKKTSCTKGW